MSSVQMEQDFAGKPDLTLPTMRSKVQQIHLFLPELVSHFLLRANGLDASQTSPRRKPTFHDSKREALA